VGSKYHSKGAAVSAFSHGLVKFCTLGYACLSCSHYIFSGF